MSMRCHTIPMKDEICRGDYGADVGKHIAQSSRICGAHGPFPGYEENREPMLDVIRMHREAMRGINGTRADGIVHGGRRNRGTPR